eukprot:5754887-Prymnesium_polylepis.1
MVERVAALSPLVLRVLGHNPGPFSLQGTNMYLVGRGASRILIDAGEDKKEDLPTLLQAMSDHGAERVSDVIITCNECLVRIAPSPNRPSATRRWTVRANLPEGTFTAITPRASRV